MEGVSLKPSKECFNVFGTDPQVGQDVRLCVRESAMDEKAAAIACLGVISAEASKYIEGCVDQLLDILLDLVNFDIAPFVAPAAIVSSVQLLSGMLTLVNPTYDWVKGVIQPLPPAVAAVGLHDS
jgi:hypothetical protein